MVQIETHENEPRHRLSALRAGHPVTYFDIIAALISHFLTCAADARWGMGTGGSHTLSFSRFTRLLCEQPQRCYPCKSTGVVYAVGSPPCGPFVTLKARINPSTVINPTKRCLPPASAAWVGQAQAVVMVGSFRPQGHLLRGAECQSASTSTWCPIPCQCGPRTSPRPCPRIPS